MPDVVCSCKFMMYCGLTLDHMASIIEGLTGWDISVPEMIRVGERVSNLQRMFNIREGFSPKDDVMPKRIRSVPAFGAYSEEERCAITKETNQSVNTRSAEVHENAAQTNTNTHICRGISQSVELRQPMSLQASDNIELN